MLQKKNFFSIPICIDVLKLIVQIVSTSLTNKVSYQNKTHDDEFTNNGCDVSYYFSVIPCFISYPNTENNSLSIIDTTKLKSNRSTRSWKINSTKIISIYEFIVKLFKKKNTLRSRKKNLYLNTRQLLKIAQQGWT